MKVSGRRPDQGKLASVVFCLVIAAVISGLGLLNYLSNLPSSNAVQPPRHETHGLTVPNLYYFGNNATQWTGWLMPANHFVSTSFVTSHSLGGFIALTVNVIPYELGHDTQLHLGLYVNGVLESSNSVNASTSAASASIAGKSLATELGTTANFTKSVQGYSVGFSLPKTLPAGTTVSIGMFATSPIWIQTAQVANSSSSTIAGLVQALPGTLPSSSNLATIPNLSVWGESNET